MNGYIIADKRHLSIHLNDNFNQISKRDWEWDVPSVDKKSYIIYMAISKE